MVFIYVSGLVQLILFYVEISYVIHLFSVYWVVTETARMWFLWHYIFILCMTNKFESWRRKKWCHKNHCGWVSHCQYSNFNSQHDVCWNHRKYSWLGIWKTLKGGQINECSKYVVWVPSYLFVHVQHNKYCHDDWLLLISFMYDTPFLQSQCHYAK